MIMFDDLTSLYPILLSTWLYMGAWMVLLALIFAVLSKLFPLNRNIRWWRSEALHADLYYWFVVPLINRGVKFTMLGVGVGLLLGLEGEDLVQFYQHGYGPLSELNIGWQVLLILVLSDIPMYWIHRLFHQPTFLWRFHAIHHAPKDLDWISTMRFHPVNSWLYSTLVDVVMLLLGFAPMAFVLLGPFNIAYSAFVHANINVGLGPLKYVISTPIFHRWHHTSVKEGGNKNFAPTFPILDILFGTFYMPKDKLPEAYGIHDKHFPESFLGQMIYPFKRK